MRTIATATLLLVFAGSGLLAGMACSSSSTVHTPNSDGGCVGCEVDSGGATSDAASDAGTDSGHVDPAHDPACSTADGGLFTQVPESCVDGTGRTRVTGERNVSGTLTLYVCSCTGGACPCGYGCGTAHLPPNSGYGDDASVPNVCVPQ